MVGWPVVEQKVAVWLRTLPAPQTVPSGPEIAVKVGETITIRVTAEGAGRYEWTLSGAGEISGNEGPAILYTAPNEPGVATLSVTAHNKRGASPSTLLVINILCPSIANAEGTVSPTVVISSITFLVNGVEQVVDDLGSLHASVGDQVEVKEVTVCVDPFEGNGGHAYFELDPVSADGEIIASETRGTRAMTVAPGFTTISGPDHTWTIGGNWRHFSVAAVHYPSGGGTQNPECEWGLCEVDDRMIVHIQ